MAYGSLQISRKISQAEQSRKDSNLIKFSKMDKNKLNKEGNKRGRTAVCNIWLDKY
jgi:hypothetical protein